MTSIAKQNTIDALTIYHKAQTNKWEVRVTDGNVRIASWTDKFSSIFKNFFNPNRKRTDWNEKAELAIQHKLFGEVSLFQEKIEVKSVTSLLKNIFLSDIKNPEPNFKSTLENSNLLKNNEDIKQLWDIKDKKIYGLVVEELMNTPNSDLRKATIVANHTVFLIKEFGLSKKDATEASRKTCVAMDEFNIESEKAFELVQVRGNLINKGYLKEDLPLKLQLSASLAFMQLREEGTNRNEAMIIVKNRIDMLKEIQNRIPLDMQIDCVHKKEYEYKISFSKEEKEKIAEKLKTQLNSPLCKINKSLEKSTKKDLITKLAEQCIADAIRSKRIFKKDGINIKTPILETTFDQTKAVEKYSSNRFLNDEFETFKNDETIPDSNIEDTPESLLEKSFLIPLENFQLQSNLNTKNITDISHFLSQTTLGTLTGLEFDKSNAYIQGVSSNKRGETIYEVDFIDNETKEGNRRIVLSASQYNDGDNLSIIKSVDTGSLTTMLPINEFFNYKQDEKAGPNKFRQKMNVDFEILINQNNEIKIRVIDAGFIYKFSINYEKLDTIEKDEVFLQ